MLGSLALLPVREIQVLEGVDRLRYERATVDGPIMERPKEKYDGVIMTSFSRVKFCQHMSS